MISPIRTPIRARLVFDNGLVEPIYTFETALYIVEHLRILLNCTRDEINTLQITSADNPAPEPIHQWMKKMQLDRVCCTQRHTLYNCLQPATLWSSPCVSTTCVLTSPPAIYHVVDAAGNAIRCQVADRSQNTLFWAVHDADPQVKAFRDIAYTVEIELDCQPFQIVQAVENMPATEKRPVVAMSVRNSDGLKTRLISVHKAYRLHAQRDLIETIQDITAPPVSATAALAREDVALFRQTYRMYFDTQSVSVDCLVYIAEQRMQFQYCASYYHNIRDLLASLPLKEHSRSLAIYNCKTEVVLSCRMHACIMPLVMNWKASDLYHFRFNPGFGYSTWEGVLVVLSRSYPFKFSCHQLHSGHYESVFCLEKMPASTLDLVSKIINTASTRYRQRAAPFEEYCGELITEAGLDPTVCRYLKEHRSEHPLMYGRIISKMNPRLSYTIHSTEPPLATDTRDDVFLPKKYYGIPPQTQPPADADQYRPGADTIHFKIDDGYVMDFIVNSLCNQGIFKLIPNAVQHQRPNADVVMKSRSKTPHCSKYNVMTGLKRVCLPTYLPDIQPPGPATTMYVLEGTIYSSASALHILHASIDDSEHYSIVARMGSDTTVQSRLYDQPARLEAIVADTREHLIRLLQARPYLIAQDCDWPLEEAIMALRSGEICALRFRRLLEEFFDRTIVVIDQDSPESASVASPRRLDYVRNKVPTRRPAVVLLAMTDTSDYRIHRSMYQTIIAYDTVSGGRHPTHNIASSPFMRELLAGVSFVDIQHKLAQASHLVGLEGKPLAQLLDSQGQVVALRYATHAHGELWVHLYDSACEPLDIPAVPYIDRDRLIGAELFELIRPTALSIITCDASSGTAYGYVFKHIDPVEGGVAYVYIPTAPHHTPPIPVCSAHEALMGLRIIYSPYTSPARDPDCDMYDLLCCIFSVYKAEHNELTTSDAVHQFIQAHVYVLSAPQIQERWVDEDMHLSNIMPSTTVAIKVHHASCPSKFLEDRGRCCIIASPAVLAEFMIARHWTPQHTQYTETYIQHHDIHTVLAVMSRHSHLTDTLPICHTREALGKSPAMDCVYHEGHVAFRVYPMMSERNTGELIASLSLSANDITMVDSVGLAALDLPGHKYVKINEKDTGKSRLMIMIYNSNEA